MITYEKLTEITIESTEVFAGKMLHAYCDTVNLPNGKPARREYVRHIGAVAIVPMSKHSLDIADVYVLFKKQCGKRMTEHMWSYMLLKPGNVSIMINHETDRLVREFVFKFIYEEIMAAGNLFLKSILIQGKGRNYLWISNLQDSFPGTFSINQYGIIFQIDIRWAQST